MRIKNKLQLYWKPGHIAYDRRILFSLALNHWPVAVVFALDSAAAETLLISHSLSFLVQAIGVSYLDLLPIHFGLSG